jgi:ribosomal protein S16
MLYSVDKNFEAKLPENKFLKMFNFVNDDLSLVNDKGETVDLDGRRIDKNGYYIDSNGSRVDRDGNPLDEFGNYIPTVTYLDEKNNAIVQESSVKVEAETKKTKTKPTVS